MSEKMKVILVDDHKMFRDGIKSILTVENIADVIGEASNGVELIEMLKKQRPNLILMGIGMHNIDGIETTKKTIGLYPHIKILVLSVEHEDVYCQKMIKAGANGFVLKPSGIEELKNAISHVSKGKSYFSTDLLRSIIQKTGNDQFNSIKEEKVKNLISKRELEVLRLICRGLSSNKIAKKLFISPKTVKGHRNNILSKTGCHNTASLVMYSIKNELIKL